MSGKYNGWNNYETWAAKLWMDNDHGTYLDVTAKAAEIVEEAREDETEPDAYAFGDWLKDYSDGNLPELPASLASDLLRSAFSEIDWTEIAESLLADAKEG